MFGRERRRSTLGPVPYLLLLVAALTFGLSVALVMLIFEDDLDVAAMPIVVLVAGSDVCGGQEASGEKAPRTALDAPGTNPRWTCGNRKQRFAPMVAGPRDIRARDT
jgi:hypothetical protein